MANETKFETMDCTLCEVLCMDAVDGTMTPAEMAAFELHVAGCVQCATMLAEAQRGAAWMEMLKGHKPTPPADLLQRILAETSGIASSSASPLMRDKAAHERGTRWVAAPTKPGWFAGLRERISFGGEGFAGMHPRFAMTTAMAFFSLALTMNMAGIRLADLRPGTLTRTVSDVRANVTRSFANMRVVRQMESRVDDLRDGDGLRRDDTRDPAGPFGENNSKPAGEQSAPAQQPQGNKNNATPQGSSELHAVPQGAGQEQQQPSAAVRSSEATLQEGL